MNIINKIMAWAEGKWIHDPLMMFFMIFSPDALFVWLPKLVGFVLAVLFIIYLVKV